MAVIEPLGGLYFNPDKVANLLSVTTPPAQYINEEERIRLYAQNPLNVVRLHAGINFPTDDINNNALGRAGKYLNRWLEQKDLLSCSALYALEHPHPQRQQPLLSLLARIRIDNLEPVDQQIQPDTSILNSLDYLKLSVVPSPITYTDPSRGVETILKNFTNSNAPLLKSNNHCLWSIKDSDTVNRLKKRFAALLLSNAGEPSILAAHQAYAVRNKKYLSMMALLTNHLDLPDGSTTLKNYPVGIVMDYWGSQVL